MLGFVLNKENLDIHQYTETAEWCNNNDAHIEDRGEYFEVVANERLELTRDEQVKQFTDFVENYMNETVQTRGYDSLNNCIARYYNSPVEKYRNEARAVNNWVGNVWVVCERVLNEVERGERSVPTVEELVEMLPVLDW